MTNLKKNFIKRDDRTDLENAFLMEYQEAIARRQPYDKQLQEFDYAYHRITDSATRNIESGIYRSDAHAVYALENDSALSKINLPVELSVIIKKLADILEYEAKGKYIPARDDDDISKGRALLMTHRVNAIIQGKGNFSGRYEKIKAILSSLIFGNGFLWFYIETFKRNVSYKTFNPETKAVEAVRKQQRKSRIVFKHVDIRHFVPLRGALDIDDIHPVVIDEYVHPDTCKKLYEDYDINWEEIRTTFRNEAIAFKADSTEDQGAEVYHVQHIYYPLNDKYVLAIDGKFILEDVMPLNPENGMMMVPVMQYIDYPALGSFQQISDSYLIKPHREIKNNLFNIYFDVSKRIAFPFLRVDPESDWDYSTYSWGDPIIEASKGEVEQFPLRGNLGAIDNMLSYNEDQQTISTGINQRAAANAAANETATRTIERRKAELKTVEFYLKLNEKNFIRFYTILGNLAQIVTIDFDKDNKAVGIPIKMEGKALKRKEDQVSIIEEESDGHNVFMSKPGDFEGSFDVLLEMGNIAMMLAILEEKKLSVLDKLRAIGEKYVNLDEVVRELAKIGEYEPDQFKPTQGAKIDPKQTTQFEQDAQNGLSFTPNQGLNVGQDQNPALPIEGDQQVAGAA